MAAAEPAPAFDREWEDLFWAVFDASRNAMLITGDDRRIIKANRAAAALTGYELDELIGMASEQLFERELREQVPQLWSKVLRRGALVGARRLQLAGGGTVPVCFCISTVVPGQHLIVYRPWAQPVGVHGVHPHRETDMPTPTRRQKEVITQLALGLSAREIADELVISEDTVRTHVRNAMSLTGARNRAHLVAQALQNGWIVDVA